MAYRRTASMQARLDLQRRAVVHAAAELLAERGYAACTIIGVAERAGVASGTVYNHFQNKTGLITELFETVVGREVEVVRAHAAHGSAAERIRAVIETFAGRALKSPRQAYALLAEPVEAPVEALRLRFRQAFRDVLYEAVDLGVRTGELPAQNAAVVAAALVGAVGEALTGPLAAPAEHPDTLPSLIAFTYRAIGVSPDADA
ncbi:TetR/AcrR family transcriptional regulator [uncultured Jatrophihabitans sp.]|uniref:TetR/AcrR family transcriptional regulator n=1 Tax=uncultured Jatrophihabitans sp. TaxID=1610747 RepID=UPI0035CA45B6